MIDARVVLRVFAVAVLASVPALLFTGCSEKRAAAKPRPDLQRILNSLTSGRDRIAPGATAYVSGPSGTWLGSAGMANVETGDHMEPDARMRLESVSKIWTAVLVLQLAEDGELQRSDTVERWLPGLLPYGKRITVGQLLTHTSGIVDNNDIARNPARYLARVKDPELRSDLVSLEKRWQTNPALEFPALRWIELAAWQPLLFEPGTSEHYSNIGFEILGLIAERASGASLTDLYRERIFEPLGLKHTAYDPQGPIGGSHASGYRLDARGKPTDATDWHGGIAAEGGIVSNAEDTAAFLTGVIQAKLLRRETVAQMESSAFWSGGEESGCAGLAYGHSGAGSGFKTNVWVSGDGGRAAVLLLNGRPDDAQGDTVAGGALTRLYCAA